MSGLKQFVDFVFAFVGAIILITAVCFFAGIGFEVAGEAYDAGRDLVK